MVLAREGTWDWVIGRRTEHLCPKCGRRFAVHDVRGVVFACLAALALFAAGGFVVLHPPGAAVGAAQSNRLFGVVALGFGALAAVVFTRRIWLRSKHPPS